MEYLNEELNSLKPGGDSMPPIINRKNLAKELESTNKLLENSKALECEIEELDDES
jgi:hypothetical protein